MAKKERLYRKQINQHLRGYQQIKAKEELPMIGWSSAAACTLGAIAGVVSYAITKNPDFATGLGIGVAGTGTVLAIEGLALAYDPTELGGNIRELREIRNKMIIYGFISNDEADMVYEKFGIPPIYSGKTKKKGIWPLKKGC